MKVEDGGIETYNFPSPVFCICVSKVSLFYLKQSTVEMKVEDGGIWSYNFASCICIFVSKTSLGGAHNVDTGRKEMI